MVANGIGQFLTTVTVLVANQPTELDLVIMTPGDVGCGEKSPFEVYMDTSEFYSQVLSQGLQLCPPEVGQAVLDAYPHHPWGVGMLYIGMEPAKDERDGHYVYCVTQMGQNPRKPWLGHWPDPPGVHRDDRWVFVRPTTS